MQEDSSGICFTFLEVENFVYVKAEKLLQVLCETYSNIGAECSDLLLPTLGLRWSLEGRKSGHWELKGSQKTARQASGSVHLQPEWLPEFVRRFFLESSDNRQDLFLSLVILENKAEAKFIQIYIPQDYEIMFMCFNRLHLW